MSPPDPSLLENVGFWSPLGKDSGVVFQVRSLDTPRPAGLAELIWMTRIANSIAGTSKWSGLRRIAGLPAVSEASFVQTTSSSGVEVWRKETWIFDEDADLIYVVGCQYEEPSRSSVEAGCDRILATFSVAR